MWAMGKVGALIFLESLRQWEIEKYFPSTHAIYIIASHMAQKEMLEVERFKMTYQKDIVLSSHHRFSVKHALDIREDI